MPAVSENPRLRPFAGERVVARGRSYRRGGSMALVIEAVERETK
jgi:hypothetical protein